MSSFDRYWTGPETPKSPMDQILTSWFLEPSTKLTLSEYFLHRISQAEWKAKTAAGIFEYKTGLYLPLYYKGKIPSPDCKELFLSFRKLKDPRWTYGYVMVKEALPPLENQS